MYKYRSVSKCQPAVFERQLLHTFCNCNTVCNRKCKYRMLFNNNKRMWLMQVPRIGLPSRVRSAVTVMLWVFTYVSYSKTVECRCTIYCALPLEWEHQ